MIRLAPATAVAILTLLVAAPALAADFSDNLGGGDGGGMRGGFSEDGWANSDENDPLSFETGVRYWYSIGSQNFGVLPDTPALTDNSTAQSGEVYGRVNDSSTGYYAKALGGLSFQTGGSYSGLDSGTVAGGHIGYAGGDVGYTWLGKMGGPLRVGPFAGYMYWNDSPNASATSGPNSFTTATSSSSITYDQTTGETFWPGDSRPNNVELNMLRLGMSGEAKLGMFDFTGEVAAVPYAKMTGVLGTVAAAPEYWDYAPGTPNNTKSSDGQYNIASIQSSPTNLDGWGYGAMAEALVGFHPTNNMTLRLGGRAWYLQGTADATFSRAEIGNPSDSDDTKSPNFDTGPSFSNQVYITRNNPWSLFRYGALAEFSYQF